MTLQKANEFVQSLVDGLNIQQSKYLSYRVCGFSPSESLAKSKVSPTIYQQWLTDSEFTKIEQTFMGPMRAKFAEYFINSLQVKNSIQAMELDSQILDKALVKGLENLGKDEFDYLKSVRNHYNPNVQKFLGLQEQGGPEDFDEFVIMMARRSRNGSSYQEDQDSKSIPQRNFIEAEYSESPMESEDAERYASDEYYEA